MWETILTAILTAVGRGVLSYFDSKEAKADSKEAAVNSAANEELKDVGAIADEQAKNNVVDRGSADDVAARLRARLAKSGAGKPNT